MDRRLKIYRIQEHFIFNFWASGCRVREGYREVSFPALDIPEDAEVLSVHHDPYSKCFTFCVRHSSFAEVPDGEDIPSIRGVVVKWKNYFMVDGTPVTWWQGTKEDVEEIKRLAKEHANSHLMMPHTANEGTCEKLDGVTIYRNLRDPLPEDTWVRINGPRGGKWLKNTKTGEVVQDKPDVPTAEDKEKVTAKPEDPVYEAFKRTGYEFL